jgi:preprotein translocase subunit SecB
MRSCRFEDRLFGPTDDDKERPTPPTAPVGINMGAQVTVWVAEDKRSAVVRLVIDVEPLAQPSWSASVEVVGQYSCGPSPVIPLERFARYNGIAYLVPYVRERLANLTAASVFQTFILPPIGVEELLKMSARVPKPPMIEQQAIEEKPPEPESPE